MNNVKPILLLILVFTACNNRDNQFDASGNFEATEIIVAAEATGKIQKLDLQEGDRLASNQRVGYIDSAQLYLSKLQLKENKKAVLAGRPDIQTQIESTKKEIESTLIDKKRIENLVKGEVATQQQLDDINSKLSVLQARYAAQKSSLTTSTAALNEQSNAIDAQLAVLQDQIRRCVIINPAGGTVLTKYAEQYEVVTTGKAIYKLADLSTMQLRAYISGNQLSSVKLGQAVKLMVDDIQGGTKTYEGLVEWVSDQAEFTPKTIQTKDERANLVYAVKIRVKNDGSLKIGMYADVSFK